MDRIESFLKSLFSALAIAALLCIASPSSAGVLDGDGIATYGDSMTMQYSFWVPGGQLYGLDVYSDGTQLNWVDHLVMSGYNFGPQAFLESFAINRYSLAIAAAHTEDLHYMYENFGPEITPGEAKLTVMNIGANDIGDIYGMVYNRAAAPGYNALADVDVQNFLSNEMANITEAVDYTLAFDPSMHMIMTTLPDLAITTSYLNRYTNPAQRDAVTPVVQEFNNRILALAASHGFPVVDLYNLAKIASAPPELAGVQILTGPGTTGDHVFLSDGFHPGTVLQGLLANTVLMANQLGYGDAAAFVSDQTIITRAGLTPVGPGPTYFDVTPYVILTNVPEPSTMVLAGMAGACLLVAARKRHGRKTNNRA